MPRWPGRDGDTASAVLDVAERLVQVRGFNGFSYAHVAAELGLTGGEMFAYKITGGSNLDLPDEAWATDGRQLSLEKDIYPNYKIILCISTFSATAPLTGSAMATCGFTPRTSSR